MHALLFSACVEGEPGKKATVLYATHIRDVEQSQNCGGSNKES